MPIFGVWYKGKQPVFQIKVLKCIAIHGQLSKKKITELLSANYPDVSDAIKALCEYSLIVFSYSDFSSRRAQRYYKITARGLDALIKEDPTPTEFWRAIIWFCKIAKKDIDPKMFNKYYDRFKAGKLGDWSVHGGYFQLYFFDKVLDKWFEENNLGKYYNYEDDAVEVPLSQQILECLALNRSLTLDQICNKIRSAKEREKSRNLELDDLQTSYSGENIPAKKIKRILEEYMLSPPPRYASNFNLPSESVTRDPDKMIDQYLGFIKHFVITSSTHNNTTTYELSLFGVILIFAIIRRRYIQNVTGDLDLQPYLYSDMSLYDYYDEIALNYQDKLPLIFGKWELLKSIMDKLLIEPYFDIIVYEESRSDLMSLPVVMGGNKEIYENVRALAFSVNSKLLEIYNDGLSVLEEHYHGDAPITRQKYDSLVDNKLTEIESLLKYADLKIFSRSLQETEDKFQLRKLEINDLNNKHKHELSILEAVFGEEITFLFYSNMSKKNDNALLQFTPTHMLFLGSRRKDKLSAIASSRSILLSILHRDKDIRAWFSKRLKDSLIYHKNTQDEMRDFYNEVSREKLDICKTAD